MGKLVILSGPSCAGKSPLVAALDKFHPELSGKLQKLVLYNSRPPRPGEKDGRDYHFRTRKQIESFKKRRGFLVMEVRGDIHALKIEDLKKLLAKGDVLFEGNAFMACALMDSTVLGKIPKLAVFLSPLSKEEIQALKSPARNVLLSEFVADIQRRKLLGRMRNQKGIFSLKDLGEVERRCLSAYGEMKYAHRFDFVLPNHDGEDSDNWTAFYFPVGDARKSLEAFADILRGKKPAFAESWEAELLP